MVSCGKSHGLNMHHIKKQLETIGEQIQTGLEVINLPSLHKEKEELETEMQQPGFWDDSHKAQEISKRAAEITEEIEQWEKVDQDCQDLLAMLPEIHPEQAPEEAEEYRAMVTNLEERWDKLNIATFMKEKFDRKNAILTVYCGLGGKDAQDFAQMLARMYIRYAEKEAFDLEILEETSGDEVGIKQMSVLIKGPYAYGYLKHEGGIQRLIRLSPFNSGNTRETSFARVEVIPELHFDDHVEIDPEDLRIDTYRASGAGGQHVNTTDSAVRITHLPTDLVVQCQNERSQAQNKERAMQMLQGKLQQLMHERQLETINDLKGEKTEIAWGHQIRTYTLNPYQLVKDHRTSFEAKNPEAVLDGELQEVIEAGVEWFAKEGNK